MKTLFFKIRLLSIFIIVCFEAIAQGDSSYIDSLKKVLLTQKEDTNKVNTLTELSNSLFYQITDSSFNTDSSFKYASKALTLSHELNYLKGEGESYYILGRSNHMAGNDVSAFQYVKKAIELFRKSGNNEKLLDALNLYANLMDSRKNFREQLNLYLEAEKIALRLHDTDNVQMISGNIGTAYKELGTKDSAETYYKRAYELSTKIKNDYGRVAWLTSLGLLYLDEGRYKEAADRFQQCLSFSHLDNSLYWLGSVYLGIGKLFLINNNIDSALYYANKSFDIENSHPAATYAISDPAQFLSELYEKKNNYKTALHFYKLATSAKDSIYRGEQAQQLSSLFSQEKEKEQELAAAKKDFKNKLELSISLGILVIVISVALLLYRNNGKQKDAKAKIEKAYSELKSTQAQLIQSEKMASLGELTAGIAHEIQNPLNFVNNFSEVNREMIEELKSQKEKLKSEELDNLLNDISDNEEKINQHGKRADAIVKGMLQHSRKSEGIKELTDINALCDEYLRLAYHGMRGKEKEFNCEIKTDFDNTIGKVNLVSQDIGRVLLNLFNNAFYACAERSRNEINESSKPEALTSFQKLSTLYKPIVSIQTKRLNDKPDSYRVEIRVEDNGNGIPQNIINKIFQPFFTTKPTGEGTGLGLSLAYDIVTKGHGGSLMMDTKEGEFAAFTVELPIHSQSETNE